MKRLDARLAALAQAGRHRAPAAPGLGELALRLTAQEPDRVVISYASRRITRRALLDMALRLGGGLQGLGLARGAVIAFQLPNWWEACVINLAAALFGYRIVPLMPIYRAAELGHILPACEVEAIFVPRSYRSTDHAALVAALPAPPRHVLTLRDGGGPDTFERLLEAEPGTPAPAEGRDAKLVIFTSGSTGKPKGVIHTHDAMHALIRRTAEFWGTGPDDLLYVPSPIGHVGGALYAFEFPWITGCSVFLEESWEPELAVRRIDEVGATFMAGATPFLSGLIEAAERAGSPLPSLRRFICGGASVPPEMVRRGLAAFPGAVVSRAYGSSEVSLVSPGARTRADAEAHADADGEVTVELRLLDTAGAVTEGEGEIAVRCPQMFAGYLDPEDDAGAFTPDGFFRMGDLGRLEDAGFITITGRTKDIIIRKGENISPLEIENALARHPSVRACAVVGRADPERGELVLAFVVPAAGAGFDLAEMSAHLDRLGLARQKFPEWLKIVEALPVNTVGKVQKPLLREIAAGLTPQEVERRR
ncbi:MAG: AMP-binding protein [Vannielia sp.]|uniref:AMP-binding protein n=1 Tax=Vannielia sp. TaxID=2813045 RepID=UPI003B8E998B